MGPGAGRPALNGILIPLTLCLSFVLGPILGGAISSQAGWSWIFWIKYVLRNCNPNLRETD